MSTPKKVKIVVIGAGIAGITAARQLADAAVYDVTVLEANPVRYGGRICSTHLPKFADAAVTARPIEFGAMWIHHGQDPKHPVSALCRKFELKTEVCDLADSLILNGGSGQYTPLTEVEKELDDFEKACDDVQSQYQENPAMPDVPILTAIVDKFPMWKELLNSPTHANLSIKIQEGWTGDCIDNISARFRDNIGDTQQRISYEGKDLRISNGYFSLVEKLVHPDDGSADLRIILGAQVVRITTQRDTTQVSIETSDGRVFSADVAVIAVPLGVLKANAIEFIPALPPDHTAAVQRIGFGNYKKALIVFDRVFWPDHPSFFSNTIPPTLAHLIVNLHALNGITALLVGLSGKDAYEADNQSDETLLTRILTSLRKLFGSAAVDSAKVRHFQQSRWRTDPFCLGTYSYAAAGMHKEDAYNIRRPIQGRIFFAGEHTAFPEEQYSTVTGAYLSGLRVAAEIQEQTVAAERNDPAPEVLIIRTR